MQRTEFSVTAPTAFSNAPVPPTLVSVKKEIAPPTFASALPPLPPLPSALRVGEMSFAAERRKKSRARADDEYDDEEEVALLDEEEAELTPKTGALMATVKKQKKDKPPMDPEGYRFRKYGKKMIGDEARHYYRCTFPGCDAKRHVTYRDGGPSVVLLGEHGHAPPTASQRSRSKKAREAPPEEPVRRPQRSPAPPRMMGSFVAPTLPLPPAPPQPLAAAGSASFSLAAAASTEVAPPLKREGKRDSAHGGTAVFTDVRRFVEALEDFEERCEREEEECSFVLGGRLDHCQDGQFWVSKNPPTNTVFACTFADCTAHKRVYQASHGAVVTYIGPHSHQRPLVLPRRDESSTSGSRGSLGDVYALLAGDMADL